MTPTFLELVVAVLLLWVAWQLGLMLTPHIIAYFRRMMRTPRVAPTPAERAAEAFRSTTTSSSPDPTHGHDR